jgi:hypothetical protein
LQFGGIAHRVQRGHIDGGHLRLHIGNTATASRCQQCQASGSAHNNQFLNRFHISELYYLMLQNYHASPDCCLIYIKNRSDDAHFVNNVGTAQ